MKTDAHPTYVKATATCGCGSTFETRSTSPELRVELCNVCHPFFTGKQRLVDSGGRVERFQRRYGARKGAPTSIDETPTDETPTDESPTAE